ncbi:ATP-binding protein [Rhodococcus hoagii]|nr:ATP-binding protein [Prescottella equi]NKS71722.1 ATP-binding protein [Prescottella equi]
MNNPTPDSADAISGLPLGLMPSRIRERMLAGELPDLPYDGAETADDAAARAERRRTAVHDAWTAQVPPLYRDARLDSLKHISADDIRTWWDGPDPTMLIEGPVGTEKTWAGYAIADHAARLGLMPAVIPIARYFEGLRDVGSSRLSFDEQKDLKALLARVQTCRLLVVDDLAMEKGSEWTQEKATSLLNERLNHGLRTVFTTNASGTRMTDLYGPRFMSRLDGSTVVIRTSGPDRRMQAWEGQN